MLNHTQMKMIDTALVTDSLLINVFLEIEDLTLLVRTFFNRLNTK